MPQISIITPILIENDEQLQWFDIMLQSLIRQDHIDWEAILVDDGSPVNLDEIKRKYQNEPRFRWFTASHNQGPSSIRNTAVELARADCLLPLDADDMLPTNATLRVMYHHYNEENQESIIYGNLQRLTKSGTIWSRSGIFQLPDYDFEKGVMNLNGVIPVTAMHSRACHVAAGGWKPELSGGLEDVEYWIAAGSKGFCGKRINEITLLYRRSDNSRYRKLQQNQHLETEMRNWILDRHKELYKGNFPMRCCGKGTSASTATSNRSLLSGTGRVTSLDSFSEAEKVWVEYKGRRQASFSVLGRTTKTPYSIQGIGHKFEVHRDDSQIFKQLGRGQDFLVGIPDPLKPVEPVQNLSQPIDNGSPEMARLVKLDIIAESERGISGSSSPEITLAPLPVFIPSEQDKVELNTEEIALDVLGLSENMAHMLELENWTVAKLAKADEADLTPYKGIGSVKANQIIGSAKQWLEQAR